jgi:hypothetical protein
MKRQFVLSNLVLLFVLTAISSLKAQQYDDLYYDPKTDHEQYYGSTENFDTKNKNTRTDNGLTQRGADNQDDTRYEDEEDEDGYFYSSRIRRFHRPARFHYYDMWTSPWAMGFNDPWFDNGVNIHIYGGRWNRWNAWNSPWGWNNGWNSWGWNSWNAWNDPWCPSGWNSPWGWNNGWNSWGSPFVVNNYYFGNGWNNGWNNGWGNGWNNGGWNNGWNNGGWSNGGSNNSGNPKGTYYGPRRTGGASNPAPPVRQGRQDNTGKTDRVPNDIRNEGVQNSGETPRRTAREAKEVDNNNVRGDRAERPTRLRNAETPASDNSDSWKQNNRRSNDDNERPSRYNAPSRSRNNESESRNYEQPRRERSNDSPRQSAPSRSNDNWNSGGGSSRNSSGGGNSGGGSSGGSSRRGRG